MRCLTLTPTLTLTLHPDPQLDPEQARQEMLRRGLFQTDYRYYAKHGCFLAFLFLSGLHLSLAHGYSDSTRLLGAALIGVCCQLQPSP